MQTVPTEHLQRTIAILAEGERSATEIDIAVGRYAADRMTLRRLVDVIPEAFGLVLLPQVADVLVPTTFTAKTADGRWQPFPLEREPILVEAMQMAERMYGDGRRAQFSHVARRSGVVAEVDKALASGVSLDGRPFAGPAFANIPAEVYEDAKPKGVSLWRRLVG